MHRNVRCVGMGFAANFIGQSATQYCELNFSSVFRFSFPLHFTCLAVKSKEQNGSLQCAPSCDVIQLADSASRVCHKQGSKTCLFLALMVGISNF